MNVSQSLVEKLKADLESFQASPTKKHVGTVLESGDGIVRASGISDVKASEMVKFANGTLVSY